LARNDELAKAQRKVSVLIKIGFIEGHGSLGKAPSDK
jgi:hypothetical protein